MKNSAAKYFLHQDFARDKAFWQKYFLDSPIMKSEGRQKEIRMNISNQIKNYRKQNNLSQEELAEKIYVSRQTISNWETGKSYPDVHNLILLSTLYEISIDELIKGDVEIMKEKITSNELQSLSKKMMLFFFLMFVTLPLVKNYSDYYLILTILFGVVMIYYSIKIEKKKKELDIKTYKEIVDFMEGNPVERRVENRKKKLWKENILKVIAGMGVGGVLGYLILNIF
jgi:transcriptional regulator with XRE-family HTH domain